MDKNIDTAVAVFVKTPGLSPLKTRLAAGIGPDGAMNFYLKSLAAVRNTLSSIETIHPIWAVGEKNGLKNPLWSGFEKIHTGDGDLGQRQHAIYSSLRTRFKNVILIGADAPQISEKHIRDAILALEKSSYVFGPARDGGYYLFGGNKAVELDIWQQVPWSAEDTRDIFQGFLGKEWTDIAPLTDVDTRPDLKSAFSEMPEKPNTAQKDLMRYIKKRHLSP